MFSRLVCGVLALAAAAATAHAEPSPGHDGESDSTSRHGGQIGLHGLTVQNWTYWKVLSFLPLASHTVSWTL
jgi:hypothetical protein